MEKQSERESEGETLSGSVNVENREADFPATLDRHGKISVPDYVREMLGIARKKVRVHVSIQVKEEFVSMDSKKEE